MSTIGWILTIGCGFLVGFAKTGIGGVGMLVPPTMAMVFPAERSPGILLPMLIAADVFAVLYYHRHAQWRHVLRPMPWAVAGILAAFAMLKLWPLEGAAYARMIGAVVLLCLGLTVWQRLRGRRVGEVEGNLPTALHLHWLAVAAIGVLGGFATMVANAAGPIWIVYLLAIGLPKFEFVGTGAWFFLILNVFKVPFQADLGNITTASLMLNAATIPAILVGGLLGIFVLKRINQKLFVGIVQWLALAAALRLLLF